MPHKEAVIAKLNEVDDAVGGIGATNTILFDGKKIWASTPTTEAP